MGDQCRTGWRNPDGFIQYFGQNEGIDVKNRLTDNSFQ
jgi:hypothetical protein